MIDAFTAFYGSGLHVSCFWCLNVLGDVLVIMDLRPDESLYEAGVAREVCSKFV